MFSQNKLTLGRRGEDFNTKFTENTERYREESVRDGAREEGRLIEAMG